MLLFELNKVEILYICSKFGFVAVFFLSNFFVFKDKNKLFFVKFVISIFYKYPKKIMRFYSEITHIYQMVMN